MEKVKPEDVPLRLDGEALLAVAQRAFPRHASRTHWVIAATVLGRIFDDRLFEWDSYGKYPSCQLWAEEQADISSGEYGRLLDLWRMMRGSPDILTEEWLDLSKAKALILVRVHKLGCMERKWVTDAKITPLTVLTRRVANLGGEAWCTWSVRMPVELRVVCDRALELALAHELTPELLKDKDPAYLINHKSIRFRLVEAIMAHWILSPPALDSCDEKAKTDAQ